MQPLTVVLGIILGSAFSIAFSLAVVLLVFALRAGDHDRLALELPELVRATVLFTVLSVVAGLAFFGALSRTQWRGSAFAALAVGLTGVIFYYWP